MNEHTTPSILQRVPVILAVTAASYGLPVQSHGHTTGRVGHAVSNDSAISCRQEPAPANLAATQH
jgi:hypothetical protein